MQSLNLAYGYLCTRPTFYIFRVERLISAAATALFSDDADGNAHHRCCSLLWAELGSC